MTHFTRLSTIAGSFFLAMSLLLVAQATTFAAQKHRCQRRKDGQTPYINHPIQVMNLLVEMGGVEDAEVLSAALLHDTVEDTDTTLAEIEAHFGRRVRSLVQEVTDDLTLPEPQRKQAQIDHAPSLSTGATLIKIADKIANVTDLFEAPALGWTLERRQTYLMWAEAVIQNCKPVNPTLEAHFWATMARGRQELGLHNLAA